MKKHNLILLLGLLCLFSMTLLMTSCKQKNISASLSKMAPADIETETIDLRDSATQKGIKISSVLSVEFPTDGCFLAVNSIQEWISEMLDGTYTGKVNDGKKMLKYYQKLFMQSQTDYCNEFMDESPNEVELYNGVKISKDYETEFFVTYRFASEAYLGGAHGSHYASGQTFRKLDGRRMDWNVFQSNRLEDVRELVSHTIQKSYFNMDDKTFQELKVGFMNGYFPLPQTMPVFIEDGVLFQYQEYEIAPYSEGAPSCIIPYSALDSLFSATGKALLGSDALAATH